MKKMFGLFLAWVCVTVCGGTPVHTVMHVGFEDYLPSASIKDGRAMGVDVELLVAAMKAVDVEVRFEMFPWSRCLHMLDHQQLDAVIPMVFSLRRNLLPHQAKPTRYCCEKWLQHAMMAR